MGSSSVSTLNESLTGIYTLERVFIYIADFQGAGTYTAYSQSSGAGISDFQVSANHWYNYDTDEYIEDNHCWFTRGNTSGQGITGSVTITTSEYIGSRLVVDGNFNITLTEEANDYSNGPACALPVAVTGDFRVATD